jgi:hypothetical protein
MSTNQTTTGQPQPNIAIEVAKQLGRNQPPTNDQISEMIQKTQNFIDEKQADSTIPFETLKTMTDFKGVLQATEQLNRNKNEDESIQKIIQETVSAAKDIGQTGKQIKSDPSLQGKGTQFSSTGKQLSQSVWEILKLMGTSGQFRSQINSLIGFLQEIFLTEGGEQQQQAGQIYQQSSESEIETEHLIKPSVALASSSNIASSSTPSISQTQQEILALKNQQVGDISSEQTQQTGGRTWRINPPSAEKKHEMAKHFLAILRSLNEKDEFKTGLNDLIDLLRDLRQQPSAPHAQMQEAIRSNQHVNATYDESKKLIEKFSGRPIDPFVQKTKDFFAFVRKDDRTRSWFDDFVQLLKDSLQNPHNLDEVEYTNRIEKLITDATNLTKEQEFRDKYADVTVELRALGNSIKEDEDLKNLQVQTQKFLENFTYIDENGKKCFNTDLVSQLRTFIVPLLISQLDQIPLPPIKGSNEEMDYYFDNLILNGKQIMPDQIDIHTRSDVSLKVQQLSASHSRSSAFIQINNIKPEVSNIHFQFTRKSFPKISDEGVANAIVSGDEGITIRIALDLMKQGAQNLFQFQLTRVDVDIDKLTIEIVSAKHEFLLKLFSSVYQQRAKRMLELKIQEKLQQVFMRIQDGLNDIMSRYTPAQLKSVITDKIGKLKPTTSSSSEQSATATPTALQS